MKHVGSLVGLCFDHFSGGLTDRYLAVLHALFQAIPGCLVGQLNLTAVRIIFIVTIVRPFIIVEHAIEHSLEPH